MSIVRAAVTDPATGDQFADPCRRMNCGIADPVEVGHEASGGSGQLDRGKRRPRRIRDGNGNTGDTVDLVRVV